jgi:hypothetical protein
MPAQMTNSTLLDSSSKELTHNTASGRGRFTMAAIYQHSYVPKYVKRRRLAAQLCYDDWPSPRHRLWFGAIAEPVGMNWASYRF